MTSTKTGGLGDAVYVGAYDLSGDVNALSKIACPRDVLDFTTVKDSAHERQYGLRTGEIDMTSFFRGNGDWVSGSLNGSAGLSLLPRSDQAVSYFRGQAVGNPAASLIGKQINYDPTRGTDGSLTLAIQGIANGFGLEWGEQLTPGSRTDTTATAGSFRDDGASSAFGAQAYVHLFSFAGTSVTIAVQHATTSGGSYSNVTGLVTSALTTPTSVRLATAAGLTVNEFVKVTTTGTFTSAVFAVVFVRNQAAVVF